ncbi:hypothetical protein IV498_13790 [Paenarthrobacter sp. Z7-10]|uniref:hypothetical protein n=1 Tax=Paenarthrobacter sp. Z7-10 TaxID=2787635 RepID=UPI0022A8F2EA|nr:hypothetical protein [Paenarthrobacter sp. Z7-10]MCZ2404221.1 hypothetical protein [Paenarthrobacter sp. Z7-10]
MVLALVLAVLVPSSPASALQPGHQSVVVSAQPNRTTPHVLDGYVSGFAQVGDIVVVVGNFTQVRTQASTTIIPRTNIFAFKFSTGEITSFAPAVNGEVMDVLAVGGTSNQIWIAGGFSTVNGTTQRAVAKLDVTTGTRDASFKTPAFDGRIHQVMLRNGKLYVTGRFNNVAGKPWPLFAAVNPVTGAQLPEVRLDISGPRNGGALSILRADITPDGSKLVAIGNFTVVNGASRTQIFMADLTTSPTSLANWSTTRFEPLCSTHFESYMRDIDISPDGTFFAVATTGAYYANTMCDASSRWNIVTTGANQQPTWIDYTGGDTITRIAVTNAAVYVGGHFSYLNNPFVGDAVGPGAVNREGLAALDPRTGIPTTWNPGRTRGYGVYSFWATDAGLWIGSDTDRISNYQYHGRMAFMPVTGGFAMPPEEAGSLPGSVFAAGGAKDDMGATLPASSLVRREFSGTAVTASTTLSTSTDFSTVRGLFMLDGKLYSAHSDGTLQAQTFDRTTLGTASIVELNNLPAFVSDLKVMTSMFYDRVTARLYYTVSGSSNLYYRYFEPQSTITGATRFTASSDPKFATTRSTFIDGTNIYFGDTTGALTRYTWNSALGTAVSGTGVVVSGPLVDGINWAARDSFIYAGTPQYP